MFMMDIATITEITDRWMISVDSTATPSVMIAILFVIVTGWLCWRYRFATTNTVAAMRRNNSSLLHMARKSSAASLATFKQVSSSTSFARLSEAMKGFQRCKKGCVVSTISTTELFVSPETVKKMSLEELSNVIDYASRCNQTDFDHVSFLTPLTSHTKEIIAAMDTAVSKSRGVHVLPSVASSSDRNGSYDALYFCAAMRLLVEWRAVKVIPEEYKAYAVGMNVAKRDLVQNAGKVEDSIHQWIEKKLLSSDNDNQAVASPTVRELLEYEHLNNVHTRLPRLSDKTSAIGLVWMNRQLQFQTTIFANLIQVPNKYKTGIEAVRAAYKTVFDRYHGWTIQQVFNYSFNGAPPAALLFRLMNPHLVDEIRNYVPVDDDANVGVEYSKVPETVDCSLTSSFCEDDDDDDDDMVTCMPKEAFNIIKWGKDIQRNWEKLAANVERDWSNFVNHISGNGVEKKQIIRGSVVWKEDSEMISTKKGSSNSRQALTRPSELEPKDVQNNRPCLRLASVPMYILNEKALEQQVEEETTKAAHRHICLYLSVMNPLLEDLTTTIDEFGMNDPSKV